MPVIKSAIKKLKQDKKRQKQNENVEQTMTQAFKKALKGKSEKTVAFAFSAIDKAVKANIIHKNKAARLKSKLAKSRLQKAVAPAAPEKPKSKAINPKKQ